MSYTIKKSETSGDSNPERAALLIYIDNRELFPYPRTVIAKGLEDLYEKVPERFGAACLTKGIRKRLEFIDQNKDENSQANIFMIGDTKATFDSNKALKEILSTLDSVQMTYSIWTEMDGSLSVIKFPYISPAISQSAYKEKNNAFEEVVPPVFSERLIAKLSTDFASHIRELGEPNAPEYLPKVEKPLSLDNEEAVASRGFKESEYVLVLKSSSGKTEKADPKNIQKAIDERMDGLECTPVGNCREILNNLKESMNNASLWGPSLYINKENRAGYVEDFEKDINSKTTDKKTAEYMKFANAMKIITEEGKCKSLYEILRSGRCGIILDVAEAYRVAPKAWTKQLSNNQKKPLPNKAKTREFSR